MQNMPDYPFSSRFFLIFGSLVVRWSVRWSKSATSFLFEQTYTQAPTQRVQKV
jgi:hypothetical protein